MNSGANQKVTVSLPQNVLEYADRYRQEHGLSSRSEVLTLALRLLRVRELEAGYKALAEEYENSLDPLLDSGLGETLGAVDRG
jgi:Arc/MetJ-type ribon-helix-helix transcriptional regulator